MDVSFLPLSLQEEWRPMLMLYSVYNGQTGDNAVLTDDKYTTIGCAFAKNPNADSSWSSQGLWVCDLR